MIETDSGRATVIDTTYALPGLTRHVARIEEGEVRPGQPATAAIDAERRAAIRRNHTGTHLLHWALRSVLGDHVKQQGSLVAPDRLRFDFTHYNPVTPEQIAEIEDLVNARVLRDEDVDVTVMSKHEADEAGAIAFFEDKYGDEVRVVRAGSDSIELCGGTHVARLGQIGPVEIVSEGSIGSNLRRIEATTGTATLARLRQVERQLSEAADLLRTRPDELTGAVERKLAEYREIETRLRHTEQAALTSRARALVDEAEGGVVIARVDGLGQEHLRELAAQARQLGDLRAVVLGGSPDGAKAALVALVAKGSTPTAPELISGAARTVGGGGGGRHPEQAAAGGRDASRLDEALDQVRRVDQRMKDTGRVLGLDLGSRRIGVAVTDSDQCLATGVQVLSRSGDRRADHRSVAGSGSRVRSGGGRGRVYHLSMSGETGPSARAVLEEIDEIKGSVWPWRSTPSTSD